MTATYFQKNGLGHSQRGAEAREHGAMAWSKLPTHLRRGLTSKQAVNARISEEWHHTGKFATEVYVYYVAQVEAYWAAIDAAGADASDVKNIDKLRGEMMRSSDSAHAHDVWHAIITASDKAEEVRKQIEEHARA